MHKERWIPALLSCFENTSIERLDLSSPVSFGDFSIPELSASELLAPLRLTYLGSVRLSNNLSWNSTHSMIERSLYLRRAVERMFTFGHENRTGEFVLNNREWELEWLRTILKIFVKPTVGGSKYPALHLQLLYYSVLLRQLLQLLTEEEERNNGAPSALSKACDDGWEVLNEHWKKTDDQTALVLSMNRVH
jgi:hypothetical protein